MRPQRKLATLILGSVCSISLLSYTGCDKLQSPAAQADRRTDEAIERAVGQSDFAGKQRELKQALSEAADSPAARARASAALAQTEYQRGTEMLRAISEHEIEGDGL